MAFLSAMMYTTSVHSESTKFQVHSITSSSLPQSSTGVGPYGSAAVRWSWAAVWYRMTGTPPGLAAAVAGAGCRGAPAPVRSPVRAGLPGCLPVSALLVLRQLRRGIQYRGGALCSGVGQREAGGGRVGIAARRARGGGLFFASESAAAGFGHRVAWSRRGVAARA